MMESYEKVIIDNNHIRNIKDVCEVREVQIQETHEPSKCEGAFELNKQDFGFGAEIVNTNEMPKNEDQKKTNSEKSVSTEDVSKTEEQQILQVNNGAGCQDENNLNEEASDDDDEDDDDDESYQTEDDNENSQRSGHLHASQDSDDSSTTDSILSGLSDVSGREWKPISARPINWVQKQIHSGANPRDLLSQMLPSSAHQIAPDLNDMTLWRILASMLSEPPRRHKLRDINTFEDVIKLVLQSENIIVLTGAGVSVSCGIPDFRSSDGIYSRLAKDFPDLPDPQAMFDINYFSRDPRPFYKFAREIYPGQFKPSPCHRFIKLLEQKQKLLRNYTQNIDTLEQVAGIGNVIECHGSFSTASCTKCKFKCTADAIRPEIFAQRIPVCPRCQPNVQQSLDASEPVSEFELKQLVENGIMKPDIVFFGEGLPEEFHTVMARDKDKCDLLIVIGSSLKVRPVALIPSSIPAHVPQILINREQLHHLEFDVELLGDSDVIINQLCHHLGDDWKEICFNDEVLHESKELLPLEEDAATTEGEDEAQQLQDTDTQSVKSNASTDIALRSAGAYSDSGFESSTSSGVGGVPRPIGSNNAIRQMDDIKLRSPKTKSSELLPPELLEEPMDAVDFTNPGFNAFNERLGQNEPTFAANYRHLSIDSSKDSGIQCDSSNSTLASSAAVTLLPPLAHIVDTGGTINIAGSTGTVDAIITSASQNITEIAASAVEKAASDAAMTTAAADMQQQQQDLKRRQQKRQSVADRLLEGTYYCHESSSSYVFPGAQVTWCTEDEENNDDDDEDDDDDNIFDDDDDTNMAPLSPLLPPSVEAEVVNEIATTATTCAFGAATTIATSTTICNKRAAVDELTTAMGCNIDSAQQQEESNIVNRTLPPVKRRRYSSSNAAQLETETATLITATTTTTIDTNVNNNSSSRNSDSSSNATNSFVSANTTTTTNTVSTEALLQQL